MHFGTQRRVQVCNSDVGNRRALAMCAAVVFLFIYLFIHAREWWRDKRPRNYGPNRRARGEICFCFDAATVYNSGGQRRESTQCSPGNGSLCPENGRAFWIVYLFAACTPIYITTKPLFYYNKEQFFYSKMVLFTVNKYWFKSATLA